MCFRNNIAKLAILLRIYIEVLQKEINQYMDFYTIAHLKCAISITLLTHNCPQRGRFECAKV